MSKGLERQSLSRTLQVAVDYQETNGFLGNLPCLAFDRGRADLSQGIDT